MDNVWKERETFTAGAAAVPALTDVAATSPTAAALVVTPTRLPAASATSGASATAGSAGAAPGTGKKEAKASKRGNKVADGELDTSSMRSGS